MARLRVLSFLLGLISIMLASQASAQTPTPVMKQFSQFGGGGQGAILGSEQWSDISYCIFSYPSHRRLSRSCLDPRIAQAGLSAFSA